MSGVFGIYHQDKSPVNPVHLEKMAASIAHRGPDGTKIVQQKHIGFGHSMLQTTPESLYEQLPFTDTESGLTITADARIDNREELAEKLSIRNIANIPDSQLILLAFKKWGYKSFQHLIGDFSFVIWDPHNQQLVCARDYIGIKPFYYHYSPTQFLFSSEIKQLAEHPDVSLNVNEGMAGEYLSFSFFSKTETLFSNITRLAPGHYLIVQPDKITTWKYWSWEPKKRLWYKTTTEYTEHFFDIFEQAVESRLRCNSSVCAELSGGLDSSTVVGMACQLISKKNSEPLETYSMVFPGIACDEKEYIHAVVNHHNIPINYIDSSNYTFLPWKTQVKQTFEPPDFPNLSINNPLLAKIQNNNTRVILSGIGGDECFTGGGYPYLDYLLGGHLNELKEEFRFHFDKGKLKALKRCSINLSWPFIPSAIRTMIAKQTAKKHIPEWLPEQFIHKIQLSNRIYKIDPRLSLSNLGRVSHAQLFTGAGEQFFLETIDRHRAFWKTENRYPFLDQRILEFALSTPDYMHSQRGHKKHLLQDQSLSLIPTLIRNRKTKAEFSYFFNQTFMKADLFNIHHLAISKIGWVDNHILHEALSKKRHSISGNKYTNGQKAWELWFAFAINLWYKTIIVNLNKEEI